MISELRVRQLIEAREESLSPHAVRSKQSRGRLRPEEPSPVRTEFQRDRDRILYSKAFRRLKHKTQVFVAPEGDHYVTRLTHTLEVSQVARTITRALNLNEDLAEAIALGHDLGHAPFGHVGEEVLNELYQGGYRHNEQSLRVVDLLENNGRGLNLTWEVRDGILNHSKSKAGILDREWGTVGTYEGEVCKLADIFAYINHDIGDAIRAGVIAELDLPTQATSVLGHSSPERINTLVCDVIQQSWALRTRGTLSTPAVTMSTEALAAANTLRDFLFQNLYNVQSAEEEAERARKTLRLLYAYFKEHRDRMPPEYQLPGDEAVRGVVDYIAGMTDQYATKLAERL